MKILIQSEHGVRELEEGYADEKELQMFLRDHSELIPVEEIELGTPPLLCIGWEVNVASGSEDLLYIDETGLLTIVETKLGRNPEARREVVGQILEYGSYTYQWSVEDIETRAQKFLSSEDCPPEYKGLTLEQAARNFLEKTDSSLREVFSYSDFLNVIKINLERGHLRLVIAIDEPPAPLLKTVEFINRFSEHFEMYLIQLKRFHDSATGQNIFVPALFGQVAKPATTRPPGRLWDKDRFLDQASQKCPQGVPALEQLIQFCEGEKAITWGKGASVGSFQFTLTIPDGKRVPAFFVMANGKMSFDFWTLTKWLDKEAIGSYRDALDVIEDIPREAIHTDTWKEFDVTPLSAEQPWKAFKHAVLTLKERVESPKTETS